MELGARSEEGDKMFGWEGRERWIQVGQFTSHQRACHPAKGKAAREALNKVSPQVVRLYSSCSCHCQLGSW